MTLMTAPTQRGGKQAATRHLLWVDGVGGFLLCGGARVTLGHASAKPAPDIPLLADVSRMHAALDRDAEGYALEGFRKTQLNGQAIERGTLRSGDRITLGDSCQFVFTQPLPLSASARLDVVSGHRLAYPVSAILLMADTVVLSGGVRGHVSVRDLDKPIILFRHKEALAVRYDGAILVGGQACSARAPLDAGRTVTIGDVSLTLEVIV
jgi:hypothetical protein